MAPTNQQLRAARIKQLSKKGGKQPKARIVRYLKQTTEPKLVEGARSTLLLKGFQCSQNMSIYLKDLRSMLAPHVKLLTKKNAIVAFDSHGAGAGGPESLEFLCRKNDCTMFCLANHNKKRPNNICIGRLFDGTILDMIELGIQRYISSSSSQNLPKKRIGSKPLLLFSGQEWQQNTTLQKLQNLLIDLYKGDVINKIVLSGLDHIITFTVAPTSQEEQEVLILQRTYFIKLKKNPNNNDDNNTPVPLLIPCGPHVDFQIRRVQMASPDLWKASLKQPIQQQANKKKQKKNLSTNIFGETVGRLHLEKQHVTNRIQGRQVKAIRRAQKAAAQEEKEALELELQQEADGEQEEE